MRNFISTKLSQFRNFFLSQISHIKINKKLAAVIAVIIVLIAALVASLIYLGVREDKKPSSAESKASSEQAIVYKKTEGIYLTAKNKTVKLDLSDDYNLEITDDGKYLIYTTASAKVSKKYDLYICDLTKASKVKKGPAIKDHEIERDFKYKNGFLYYSKQNPNTLEVMTYRYNVKKGKASNVDFAIENIFIPSQGDSIYYTKNFLDSKALYEFLPDGSSKELAKPVKTVHFYDNGEKSELIYEVGKKDSEVSELIKVIPGENSIKIATDVSDVLYDNYDVGGNLYYFVKKDVPKDWKGIIEDDAAEDDAKINEPNKNDYKYLFGISPQFFIDSDAYKAKELRDEIRDYLNKAVTKDFFKESYTLYAKSGEKVCKIADGVSPQSVYATAPAGAPRAIYMAKQLTNSGKKISDFTRNFSKRNFKLIQPEIDEILKECVVETGLTYSYAENFTKSKKKNNSQSKSVQLKGYDANSSEFIFGKTENKFFAKVSDDKNKSYGLYEHYISENKLMPAEKIALSVKSAKAIDDTLWYIKNDTDATRGSFNKYTDGTTEILDTQVYSFVAHSNTEILLYKDYYKNNGEEIVNLYYCDGEKMQDVSESVDAKQIRFEKYGLMFIRSSGENGGELCSYIEGKLHVIDQNVYSIIDY